MSIEGLQAILEKEEVVNTQRAEDLVAHPQMVDEAYKRHVRTYVPFGRKVSGGDGQSVPDFERQVIKDVKANGAVRGYITAEYGHGKTSTALYLWQRAREANLLAVPPFQLNKLTDFILATYGWARYEIGRTRPDSAPLDEAEALYRSLIERNAAAYARRYDISESAAAEMIRDKPDILELGPADYMAFFEEMTGLARAAGYDGLLILADELQQYIDPQIKAGIKDPITPFFDVVANIGTRRNQLPFGLIVVIPPRELEVLRDQRGDFIHRLLQASLDLRTVYDREFPARLWGSLAREHKFEDHRDRILAPETLAALGQIGARVDLSDGPRTVVNTFRRATRLYEERDYPRDRSYTPESLLDDLLKGAIQYDSSKKIPQVAGRALDHSLVKGHPAREKAIKWAAAFPNEGITRELQERYGLVEAFDELSQSAQGDLIISVGDVRARGFTLKDLEPGQVKTDTISMIVREFWRNYVETADVTRQRAMDGLMALLKSKVFPETQWRVQREWTARFTQNAGLLFQGAFTANRSSYPERTVHVRLLWEDEAVKDANSMGEVLVEIRLRRYLDETEGARRVHEKPLRLDVDARTIHLTLNLMGRAIDLSPDLEHAIGSIVSPFKLTPLLLLNLFQVVEEHRERGAIPKEDSQQVSFGFQPKLLDNAFHQMFNETVGQPVNAGQERVLELALLDLLKTLYPDYKPLVTLQNWQSSLQKYQNALGLLPSNYERQAQVDYEGTKEEIAKLFTLTNTGLDSFARNFPTLIEGAAKLPGQGSGVVRFTLHPLERDILKWIGESPTTQTVRVGGQTQIVHTLPKANVYDRAQALGYLDSEIEALLGLMQARGLVEEDAVKGLWREAVTLAPSADELESMIDDCLRDITSLRRVFAADPQLRSWQGAADKSKQHVNEQLRKKPDDNQLYRLKKGAEQLRKQIDHYAQGKQADLRQNTERLARQLSPLEPRMRTNLNTSVQGSVEYVSQINDQLRMGLLRQYGKLEEASAGVQAQVKSTHEGLAQEDLAIAALVEWAEETKALAGKIDQVRKQQDEFARQYGEYADWTTLVETGNRLSEDLNQMGELVEEQRREFEQLSRDIRGRLSADKISALPEAPQFSFRLNAISEAVRAIRTTTTGKFASLQDRYREALVSALGYPREKLWPPRYFNPLAPGESYVRLREEVGKTIRDDVPAQFQKFIKEQRSSIRETLQSPLLRDLPAEERDRIEAQAAEMGRQLDDLDKKLGQARDIAGDQEAISDFPDEGEGRFGALLKQLGDVARSIRGLKPKIDELGRELQKLGLTSQESTLLEAIQTNHSAADFGTVRQASSGLREEEFWKALSGLQAKRRVKIMIERIAND